MKYEARWKAIERLASIAGILPFLSDETIVINARRKLDRLAAEIEHFRAQHERAVKREAELRAALDEVET